MFRRFAVFSLGAIIVFFVTKHAIAGSTTGSLDASTIFLESPVYSSGGSSAESVALADLNRDGKLDMVVANGCVNGSQCGSMTAGSLDVLLGNGNGTFQAPVSYSTGSTHIAFAAVADVNGDGKPDLVVGGSCPNGDCFAGGTVAVLLGNGDGTFQTALVFSAPSGAGGAIVVADVNNDGKPDVIAAGGTLGVFLGNGDGTLQQEVTYTGGGTAAVSVAVADVNGDGKPDLIVANQQMVATSNGSVGVLLGNGDGTFQPAATYLSGGQNARSVVVGDLNGDGRPDVVVSNNSINANTSTGGVGVLFGNGDGTFQPAVTYASGANSTVFSLIIDINGDANADLLISSPCQANASTTNCSNGIVSVLLGNGDGTFRPAVRYTSGDASGAAIAAGDVNGDGKTDVVVANASSIGVLLGDADGSFQSARIFSSGVYPDASEVAADLNGDGKPDLIISNLCASTTTCAGGGVGVLLGNGDGTFQSPAFYGAGAFKANSLAIADVNGDGKLDVVVAKQCVGGTCSTGTLGVLLGNGDGTFEGVIDYSSGGQYAYSVSVADVNGDGKPDVLVANQCASSSNCANGILGVLLGNGDGSFRSAITYGTSGQFAVSVTAADLNKDGKQDVVVGNYYTGNGNSNGSLGVLLGNGDGTFQLATTYSSGGIGANSVTVADVNGDGKLDLVAANQCGSTCSNGVIGVLAGNGDGTFQSAIGSITPLINIDYFEPVVQADFNGDGKLDLASAVSNFLLLGNGNGTFQPPLLLGAGGIGIAVGDFDLDGKPDLAVGGVTILMNIAPAPVRIVTNTVLTSALNPSVYGQSVSFQATVTAQNNAVPNGNVTFTDGGNGLGTVPLVNGTTTLNPSGFSVGSHAITASFLGSQTYAPSMSALTQIVNPAPTATTVAASPNPSVSGQSIIITASVTSNTATPSGTVTFFDGNTSVGTGALNASGQASINPSNFSTGNHSITASYAGTSTFAASASQPVSETVNKANTATVITSHTPSSSVAAQPVSVGFTVTAVAPGGGIPTGNVTISDGSGDSCTASVSAGSCTLTVMAAGTKILTASYAGDNSFASSASAGTSQVVTDFSLSASPTSQTLKAGQKITYKISLFPLNGFSGTIGLSCASFPPASTCSFSPVSVSLNGTSSSSSTVTVQTSRSTSKGSYTFNLRGIYGTGNPVSGGLTHAVKVSLNVR